MPSQVWRNAVSLTIIALGILVWGCRMRSDDMGDAEHAVAASLGSTGPLQFRGLRVDASGDSSLICGEVKDRRSDYRPFAFFASNGRALILPAAGSSAATMTVTSDFPNSCIPDTDRHTVEASVQGA